MKLKKELCDKFPSVLRKRLLSGELELPDTAEFSYEPIQAYRVVEREKRMIGKLTGMIFVPIMN